MKIRYGAVALLLLLALAPVAAQAQTTRAQYANQDGSQSQGVVVQYPDPNNPGKSTPTPPAQPFSLTDDRVLGGSLVLTSTSNAVTVNLSSAEATTAFQVVGLTGSGATLVSEASRDGGTTWSTTTCNASIVSTYTTDGGVRCNTAGFTNVRLRVLVAGTGSATVSYNAISGTGLVELSQPLPAGSNAIGSVGEGAGTSGATAWFLNLQDGYGNPIGSTTAGGLTGLDVTPCDVHGTCLDYTLASAVSQSGSWTVGLSGSWPFSGALGTVGLTGTLPAFASTPSVIAVPATSGGTLTYDGAVTTTVVSVKSSAGQLYGYHIGNSNTTACYLQMFNVASGSVTLGTTTPTRSLFIPASFGAARTLNPGAAFGTAISIAATTTRAGSTACTNTLDVDIDYD